MKSFTKFKIVVAIILLCVVTIFIALNRQLIEVSLIVGKIEMQCSMLIFSSVLIGVFLGWVIRVVYEHKVNQGTKKQ